jgi:hypothetical protein
MCSYSPSLVRIPDHYHLTFPDPTPAYSSVLPHLSVFVFVFRAPRLCDRTYLPFWDKL